MKCPLSFALLGLLAVGCFAETPAGFTPLFNGEDLTGWKVPEGDNGHWRVLDGVIDYDAGSEAKGNKNLVTEKEYGDYVLRLDWRFKQTTGLYPMPIILPDGTLKTDENGKVLKTPTPNADSGIYLRGNPQTQVNLWCWPCGSGEMWGYRNNKKTPPEVRAACVPKENADKPVGQWNTMEITVQGSHVTVVLNDKTVIDADNLPDFPEKGPIALQHHGGKKADGTYNPASSLIQFRNLFIKEL